MNNLRIIFLVIGLLLHLSSFAQNGSIVRNGYGNIVTLEVDFNTYTFEGGDISYYSCSNCAADSMPFTIDYEEPGDFGGVTFKLASFQDTIFYATIVWHGLGNIYYPEEYSTLTPFVNANTAINKPHDLRYIYIDGNAITEDFLISKADSAWDSIDSLEITNLFAEKGFKSAIYLYAPTVGLFDPNRAKWIIFLYHTDLINAVNSNSYERSLLQIIPNPTNGEVIIDVNSTNLNITNYMIFSQNGQLVAKDAFYGGVYKLDMSILSPGIYFLCLSDKNKRVVATEKLIIE